MALRARAGISLQNDKLKAFKIDVGEHFAKWLFICFPSIESTNVQYLDVQEELEELRSHVNVYRYNLKRFYSRLAQDESDPQEWAWTLRCRDIYYQGYTDGTERLLALYRLHAWIETELTRMYGSDYQATNPQSQEWGTKEVAPIMIKIYFPRK